MNTVEQQSMYGWKDVPWHQVERDVFKLQKRIYKAEQRGDGKAVRTLQKLLTRSRSAKLLAVRRVTQDNQGKKTAGVDGVKSLTPKGRLELSKSLSTKSKAKPTRRVWIPKPGTEEKRPLGIPVMKDRALQALVRMALEPEWEAKFEPNSYGFRPGRSAWDAIEAIHKMINLKPKWVLDADIAKCFDRIDHQALLAKVKTSPTIKRLIRGWLKAGVMDERELFPTEQGTPQGGVISPLLANIALHGLETAIRRSFKTNGGKGFFPPTLVRYADDLVVLHKDREVIEECQRIVSEWLMDMGLELKPSKTKIVHTLRRETGDVGFDFLGFHIRQYPVGKTRTGTNPRGQRLGFKTLIKPSAAVIKRHYEKVKLLIEQHWSMKQVVLIKDLNPVIRGWARYYSTVCSGEAFSKIDSLVYRRLWAWARKRHPGKSNGWRQRRYWRRLEGASRFALQDGFRLVRHCDTPIRRHTKVRGTRSPYDGDLVYWSERMGRHPDASRRVATLLKRQKGHCRWCGLYFKHGDVMEVDHVIPTAIGGKDTYFNLQLLHRHCHDAKTALDEDEKLQTERIVAEIRGRYA